MFKKLVYIFIILLSINLSAQISTDRPSISDSSTILETGNFQIESGLTLQNEKVSYFQSSRYGLSKNTEIRVGFDDNLFNSNKVILVGLKTLVFSNVETAITSISLLVETDITHIDNFIIGKVIMDYGFIKGMDLTTNVGFQHSLDNKEYPYSIVATPHFDSRWGVYGEIYGNMEFLNTTKWNLGLLFTVSKKSQIDISGGTAFNSTKDKYVSLGYSINI